MFTTQGSRSKTKHKQNYLLSLSGLLAVAKVASCTNPGGDSTDTAGRSITTVAETKSLNKLQQYHEHKCKKAPVVQQNKRNKQRLKAATSSCIYEYCCMYIETVWQATGDSFDAIEYYCCTEYFVGFVEARRQHECLKTSDSLLRKCTHSKQHKSNNSSNEH